MANMGGPWGGINSPPPPDVTGAAPPAAGNTAYRGPGVRARPGSTGLPYGGIGAPGSAGQAGAATGGPDVGSAMAQIQQLLDLYGLGSLAGWAYQQLVSGQSTDQIALSLTQTPEYAARFPAIKLRQQAGLPPISATDYVSYEDTLAQLERSAGFPAGFMSNHDIATQLLANDVSTSELSSRIQNGYAAVTQAPPAVRDAFTRMFGPSGDAALAMTFVDPKLSEAALMQHVAAANAAGFSANAGFAFNYGTASDIAAMAPTEYRMRSGLQALQNVAPLFSQTVGESQTQQGALTAANQGVGSIFDSNAYAQFQLNQAAQTRTGALSGSSGAVTTQAGEVGLGTATSA